MSDSYEEAGDLRNNDESLSSAELGAIAHLYRGEVYRSTIWRTRLDATTNWSVVSLGVALSISYSNPEASALPLLIVGAMITLFLYLESRRYRYFNVWRARARWIETNFYAPLLKQIPYDGGQAWQNLLAEDYERPQHHISFVRAMGRRLRRNYVWVFLVQALAYYGKIIIHPVPAPTFEVILERMAIGPISGMTIFTISSVFHLFWLILTIYTWRVDLAKHRHKNNVAMG